MIQSPGHFLQEFYCIVLSPERVLTFFAQARRYRTRQSDVYIHEMGYFCVYRIGIGAMYISSNILLCVSVVCVCVNMLEYVV